MDLDFTLAGIQIFIHASFHYNIRHLGIRNIEANFYFEKLVSCREDISCFVIKIVSKKYDMHSFIAEFFYDFLSWVLLFFKSISFSYKFVLQTCRVYKDEFLFDLSQNMFDKHVTYFNDLNTWSLLLLLRRGGCKNPSRLIILGVNLYTTLFPLGLFAIKGKMEWGVIEGWILMYNIGAQLF